METIGSTNDLHARIFLGLLFCNYESNGLIEFRCLGQDKKPESLFSSYKKILSDGIIPRLIDMNKEGYNIYVGLNPRPDPDHKKQKDIKDLNCLWLDIDWKDFSGGREEARDRIMDFPLPPNIILDSGNGFHVYWILEKPIIDSSEGERKRFKQILSGLADCLGADKQAINLDRVMRLPGTLNLKNLDDPKECALVILSPAFFYDLDYFEGYRNKYAPTSEALSNESLNFGIKQMLVNKEDLKRTSDDVNKLEVSKKIQQMIITGTNQEGPGKDGTRSGRDQAIITALVAADYNYPTIKSIFLNPKLGCSDRISEKGERQLRFDVTKAEGYLSKKKSYLSPQVSAIQGIRDTKYKQDEKYKRIAQFVVKDMFMIPDSAGCAYKDTKRKLRYYFDRRQKLLMNIEDLDFRCFLKDRYDLYEKEFPEVSASVETHIWKNGEEIEAHNFAFYSEEKQILYISNNRNQIFRLDGEQIKLVDNGTDGIIFELKPELHPIDVDLGQLKSCDYFKEGFEWKRFTTEDSYLYKHLIELTNFAKEDKHNLLPEEQRYLFTVFVFSMFFESILQEKPILCFEGVKASGKSFVATSLGKILFGDSFHPSHLSDNQRDFHVTLSENYYVVFDNLDSGVKGAFLNDLCIAATGGEIRSRKLYTDHEEIKARPHIFVAITSRDPKFKRDDFVDRLLLFNTEKVKAPISRSALNRRILDNRGQIWTELLVNLNTIVNLLKQKTKWNPPGIFRIADWELFGKKVHSEKSSSYFVDLLRKMNKEKSRFGLEDDPLYILLRYLVYDREQPIKEMLAMDLYENLAETAEDLKMRTRFEKRYSSPMAIAKRITNIIDEFRDEFEIEVTKSAHGKKNMYSFSKKEGASDQMGEVVR